MDKAPVGHRSEVFIVDPNVRIVYAEPVPIPKSRGRLTARDYEEEPPADEPKEPAPEVDPARTPAGG